MIKEIRESCELSRNELARKSGVHRRTLFNIETGKKKCTDKYLYKLVDTLSKYVDLAYVAGLFDRASSIIITKNKAGTTNTSNHVHYVARVVFGTKHKELAELIRSIFNIGEVSYQKSSNRYSFYAFSKSSEVVLEKLLPYLKIKRKKAEILLAFRRKMNENKLKRSGLIEKCEWDQDAANDEYEVFYQALRELGR